MSGIGATYGSQYNTEVAAPLDSVNSPVDRQMIAERYAPILVLPEGSNDNLPASAQDFIDNSRLREHVPTWLDNHLFYFLRLQRWSFRAES